MSEKQNGKTVAELAGECQARVIFACTAGSRLGQYETANSDLDVRGAFLARTKDFLGMERPPETVSLNTSHEPGGHQQKVEIVLHEARRYLELLQSGNPHILEEVCCGIPATESAFHQRLLPIVLRNLNLEYPRKHIRSGQQARTRWEREERRTAKPALMACREFLAAIRLMDEGEVEASLPKLAGETGLERLMSITSRRKQGGETLHREEDRTYLDRTMARLKQEAIQKIEQRPMPETFPNPGELEELLLDTRLQDLWTHAKRE